MQLWKVLVVILVRGGYMLNFFKVRGWLHCAALYRIVAIHPLRREHIQFLSIALSMSKDPFKGDKARYTAELSHVIRQD